MRKKTTDEFIVEAVKKHNGKYSYNKTNLDDKNSMGKVTITCPIHGDFLQTPKNHLHGQGCPKCSHRSIRYSVEEIKNKIIERYGNNYDVSLIKEYKCNIQKLPLICTEHGYFEATWNDLDNGHGCQECGKIRNHNSTRKSNEQFIKEARRIHGNKYNYALVKYKSAHSHIMLICNKCGKIFKITPHEHLKGNGCPRCNESILENEVRLILDNKDIKYIEKCKNNILPWIGRQHLDFYLPEYKIAIECQGEQHFKPIDYFGGDIAFTKRQELDIRKKKLCEENGTLLLYYSKNKVEEMLGNKIYHSTNELISVIK